MTNPIPKYPDCWLSQGTEIVPPNILYLCLFISIFWQSCHGLQKQPFHWQVTAPKLQLYSHVLEPSCTYSQPCSTTPETATHDQKRAKQTKISYICLSWNISVAGSNNKNPDTPLTIQQNPLVKTHKLLWKKKKKGICVHVCVISQLKNFSD